MPLPGPGHKRYGEQYVRAGFGWTPEDDLAFALGYPHQVTVLDEGPPASDDRALEALNGPAFRAVGRDLAPRLARLLARSAIGPQPLAECGPGPMKPAEARKLVRTRIRRGGVIDGRDKRLALLLEALFGAELVLEAITEALESQTDDQLAKWNRPGAGFAEVAGFILLRCEAVAAIAFRDRLEAVLVRAAAPAADPKRAEKGATTQLAGILDRILHGGAAAERQRESSGSAWQGAISPWDLLHVVDDPALVAAEVQKHRFDSLWIPFSRLAFLGGEPVVSHYCENWRKARDADDVLRFVTDFGRIRSDAVVAAMKEIAAAKGWPPAAAAAAWLDARPGV